MLKLGSDIQSGGVQGGSGGGKNLSPSIYRYGVSIAVSKTHESALRHASRSPPPLLPNGHRQRPGRYGGYPRCAHKFRIGPLTCAGGWGGDFAVGSPQDAKKAPGTGAPVESVVPDRLWRGIGRLTGPHRVPSADVAREKGQMWGRWGDLNRVRENCQSTLADKGGGEETSRPGGVANCTFPGMIGFRMQPHR